MRNTLFIGGGNMAFAILGGLLEAGTAASTLHVIEIQAEAQQRIRSLGVTCTADWPSGFKPQQVVLAVKPQSMQTVLNVQAAHLSNCLIISIAAGVGIAQIRQWSEQTEAPVVRCMPNTPALVGQGLTGWYATPNCSPDDRAAVTALFESCGSLVEVADESAINAITAISGSGPGYVFYWMEALEKAALELGFNAEQARLLVNQTVLGAATLASQSEDSLATLREKVTSKGGTTFAGLEAMRLGQVEQAIVLGAKAAMARAIELQG